MLIEGWPKRYPVIEKAVIKQFGNIPKIPSALIPSHIDHLVSKLYVDSLNYRGYLGAQPPSYVSASSVKIPVGTVARDTTSGRNIILTGDITISLASSGAAGLDTGSEASNTWYYVWLCEGDSGVTAIFSASSTAPTLPSGYNTYKGIVKIAVRNDGSSNIIPFIFVEGFPHRPFIQYRDYESGSNSVLSGGTQTTFTAVSLAAFVPPISRECELIGEFGNSVAAFYSHYIRATGSGLTTGRRVMVSHSSSIPTATIPHVITDANQSIDYRVENASASTNLAVTGFYVTEL